MDKYNYVVNGDGRITDKEEQIVLAKWEKLWTAGWNSEYFGKTICVYTPIGYLYDSKYLRKLIISDLLSRK